MVWNSEHFDVFITYVRFSVIFQYVGTATSILKFISLQNIRIYKKAK